MTRDEMWELNKTIIYTDITYELSNGASKYVAIYFLSLSLSLSVEKQKLRTHRSLKAYYATL